MSSSIGITSSFSSYVSSARKLVHENYQKATVYCRPIKNFALATSKGLHDLAETQEGADKILSFVIPLIRSQGVGLEALPTLKAMKELIGAKKVFNIFAKYDHEASSYLKDAAKTSLDIATVLQTLKFLKNCQILSFSWFQEKANQVGTLSLFNRSIKDIPILQSICDNPREIFLIVGLALNLIAEGKDIVDNLKTITLNKKSKKIKKIKTVASLLTISENVGKLSLTLLNRHFKNERFYVYLELTTSIIGIAKSIFHENYKNEIKLKLKPL